MRDTVIRPPERSAEQDIAKGLAILFVVFIHSTKLKSSTMDIVLTFAGYAMPFFFLMSGYYYKPGRRTWRQNVSKRLRQLLIWDVPFTLMAGILGAYTLVNFCKLVANVKILGDGLSWCGRNSLSLMLVNVPIITKMQKCLGLTASPVCAAVEHTEPITFSVFLGAVVFCVLLVLAINKVFPHQKNH